ncbi:MAG: hypothetical protein HQL83_07505 [Magnetococcales bacterium]|nr:hypothetical protein [Magnetococcales bacterium]
MNGTTSVLRCQRPGEAGAWTMVVAMVMLFTMTAMAFQAARVSITEQKISGNEIRAQGVFAAAEAGLQYGAAWLVGQTLVWSDEAGNAPYETAPSISLAVTGGYTASILFRRNPTTDRSYVEVVSTATKDGETTVTATVRQYTLATEQNLFLNTPAPIIVNGCMSTVTGNPDVTPTSAGEVTIVTSQSNSGSCIDTGHLNVNNGGTTTYEGFSPESTDFVDGGAWKYLFNITKANMLASAAANPMITWITTDQVWHGPDPGTPGTSIDNPGIFIFDGEGGCDTVNGSNATIYGIIYFETTTFHTSGPGTCDSNGFGSVNVYGSAVWEGNLHKLNANANFFGIDLSGLEDTVTMPIDKSILLPGSWRDY